MVERLNSLREAAEALIEAVEQAEDACYVAAMDRAVDEIQRTTNSVVNEWKAGQNLRPSRHRRKILWETHLPGTRT